MKTLIEQDAQRYRFVRLVLIHAGDSKHYTCAAMESAAGQLELTRENLPAENDIDALVLRAMQICNFENVNGEPRPTPLQNAILHARLEQLDHIASCLGEERARGEGDEQLRVRVLAYPGLDLIRLSMDLDGPHLNELAKYYGTQRKSAAETDDQLYNRLAAQEERMLTQELNR
jgi:hypothetical protein